MALVKRRIIRSGRGSALVTSDDHLRRVMSDMRVNAGLEAMEKAKRYVDGLEVGDIFHGLRPAAEALGYIDGIEQRCFITFGLEHLQDVIIYTDPDGRITRLERGR